MESVPPDPSLPDLRARKPETLTAVMNAHAGALLAGAMAMGLQQAETEEAVSETFVAFLAQLDRFEGRSKLRTYLFGILYHKALNLLARKRREVVADDIEAVMDARFDARGSWSRPPRGPEAEALDAETRRLIERCAEDLSEDQRAVFFLREVDRAKPEDICNALGLKPTNVRVILQRARLKLRECLEVFWEKARA